jgi:hypothetical protein
MPTGTRIANPKVSTGVAQKLVASVQQETSITEDTSQF